MKFLKYIKHFFSFNDGLFTPSQFFTMSLTFIEYIVFFTLGNLIL